MSTNSQTVAMRQTFPERVALICGGLKQAGLERIVVDLALGMRRRGVEPCVWTLLGGALEAELLGGGVEVRTLYRSAGRRGYMASGLRSCWMVLQLAYGLLASRTQAVMVHGLGVERVGLLAAWLARVPLRTFVLHSNYPVFAPTPDNQYSRRRISCSLSLAHHCFSVSNAVRDWAVSTRMLSADRVSVVRNGVDLGRVLATRSRSDMRAELGIGEDVPLLIQVGRLVPLKNQDTSVRALKSVQERHPKTELLLVGSGPLQPELHRLVQDLELGPKVHLLGTRTDVPDLLGASDIFLLPSSWEGSPISLLEAFANGVPLIGSDVPGIRDVVDMEPDCGRLVPPHDPEALAAAISAVLDDCHWRERAGIAARTLAERAFSADRMVDEYISALAQCWGLVHERRRSR